MTLAFLAGVALGVGLALSATHLARARREAQRRTLDAAWSRYR